MKLIEFPIRNRQFTWIMVIMIAVVAIHTLTQMPRAEDPDMKSPIFPVTVIYPGTSPKDMEQLVAKPLESRFYGLDGIKKIKTTIDNGLVFMFIEYQHKEDYDNKYQEVIRELSAAREELPEDIYSAEVHKIDPSGVNILQIALISEVTPKDKLKELSSDLKTRLEKIKALKDIEVSGLPDALIRIDISLDKIASLKIPLNQIVDIIRMENQNLPGGSVVAGSKIFSVKTSGNYGSIEDIKKTIISSAEGHSILLEDIADVYSGYDDEDMHITRLNGYRSVFVTAAQKEGMNITETQKQYQEVLDNFKNKLPDQVDMVVNFEQAENVNTRLHGLGIDFTIAILLVLITLLPLGLRASFVVMMAIPLSLGLGLVVVHLAGYSLNQLSIVGFVVALGLVVDDSIVVVENIERWLREGYSKLEASVKGTKQIVLAVVGCTATLVIAFLPLMFMPEMAGDFIRSMPTAVIGSVVGSMLIALLVVPLLSTMILQPHKNPDGNAILRKMQEIIHKSYGRLLDWALKHPLPTVLIALIIFIGSLFLIPVIGFSLFPSSEKPQFMIYIESPQQANIQYTDSVTKILEWQLDTIEEVKYYSSNVGKGNPRIYYNMEQGRTSNQRAEIFVQLQSHIKAKEKTKLIESLHRRWDNHPLAKIEVRDFEQGVPIVAPVEVILTGENLDSLKSLAERTEEILNNTEGAVYVNNSIKQNKTDIKLNINKDKALSLGVPISSIDQTVRIALAGFDVGIFSNPLKEDDDYKIRVTLSRKGYPDISIFDRIYVNSFRGESIPLSQLAELEFESSPSSIYHLNKERTISVYSFVDQGHSNDEVINKVIARMDSFSFPDGYSYHMGGEVESREIAFGGFSTIIIITLFLFISVLILEFKTFKSTLIVLSVIPLGIVGCVIALLITGNTLSFVATIGLVALAGIEVKNTILLVDFTNQLRKQGMALDEAIEKAGEIRFLPIILTTLTAIGGLTPIALSSNPLISPLAVVIIGGLISSTLLSRIITPVVYKLIPPAIVADEKEEE